MIACAAALCYNSCAAAHGAPHKRLLERRGRPAQIERNGIMKRGILLFLTAVMLFMLCACGKQKTEPDTQNDQPGQTQQPQDDQPTPELDEPEPAVLQVCHTDGQGGFTMTQVEAASGSPTALISALIDAGVLYGNVAVNSMKTVDEGIDLDLNAAFQTQLEAVGQSGEAALLGCVVNSFLETYGGQGVLLTVDGKSLQGASSPYEGYLPAFTSYPVEQSEDTDEPDSDEPDVPDAPAQSEETQTAASVVTLAQSLIGAPFEWGATGPDTFDNSGFVYYCFAQNGVTVPRMTADMAKDGLAVEQADLLPGDLVFFSYDGGDPSYVGIYIGDGKFIAENNEDSPVCTHDMTLSYYQDIYVCARRYA